MALTGVFAFVPNSEDVFGHTITAVYDITVTGTYSTAGISIDPAIRGTLNRFKVVIEAYSQGGAAATAQYYIALDTANKCLRFYVSAAATTALTEIAGGVAVTGTFRVRFLGY